MFAIVELDFWVIETVGTVGTELAKGGHWLIFDLQLWSDAHFIGVLVGHVVRLRH